MLLLGGPFGHGDGEKENATEAGFTVFVAVPLGESVRASAVAACAHGERGNAEGDGNVGVGRAETQIGLDAEMAIDGAKDLEDRRVAGELRGGAIADFFDGKGERVRGCAR